MIGITEGMMAVGAITGIGIVSAIAQDIVEDIGSPKVAKYIGIAAFVAAGIVAIHIWQEGKRYVINMFLNHGIW